MRFVALVALVAGTACAELGVIGDGTSISVGKPHRGYIIDGVRIPDAGEGFFTRDKWKSRGNRYGTEELVDLLTAVSRRMANRQPARLVIADLSPRGGGGAYAWHRSHQSGRDVDLLFYVRDKDGQPVEPDDMRPFDATGKARDGSGYTVDVPRTWMLVRDLLTAPEAPVQWVFMYQPIANLLIEHAIAIGEPEAIVAAARTAVRQPGNSAPHDDHMHVRIFCSATDKAYGCADIGPLERMLEREAQLAANPDVLAAIAAPVQAAAPPPPALDPLPATPPTARTDLRSVGRMLLRSERIPLRRWR